MRLVQESSVTWTRPSTPGSTSTKRAVGTSLTTLPLTFWPTGYGLDVFPRVVLKLLLEAEGDALLLAIDVEHDDIDFLADLEHLGRMVDAAPGHVGDVQQAVHAVEVDERTEVGDVLDVPLTDVAGGHFRSRNFWRGARRARPR
jgi:hypothetical protein